MRFGNKHKLLFFIKHASQVAGVMGVPVSKHRGNRQHQFNLMSWLSSHVNMPSPSLCMKTGIHRSMNEINFEDHGAA